MLPNRACSAADSAPGWHGLVNLCRGAIMVRKRSGDGENGVRGRVPAATIGQHPTGRRRRAPSFLLSLLLVLASGIVAAAIPSPAQAATLPPGFQEKIVFSGLTNPTAVRFA